MIPDKKFTVGRRQAIRTLGAAALASLPVIEQIPAWGQSACAVPGSPT